jgi:hypothetical protein
MDSFVNKIIALLLKLQRIKFYSSKLLIIFWVEVVHTTTYVLNHIGNVTLFHKTTYEAWFAIKTNVVHIRVFGYVACTHIPEEVCHKIFAKSKKCVFISYNDDCKAYRLWDLEAHKIIVS